MLKRYVFFLLVFFVQRITPSFGQLIFEENFFPGYSLERNVRSYSGPKSTLNLEKNQLLFKENNTPVLFGCQKSKGIINLFSHAFTNNEFSLEFLLIDHVNQPIGLLLNLQSDYNTNNSLLNIAYYDKQFIFFLNDSTYTFSSNKEFKKYWQHVVLTYKNHALKIYLNGIEETSIPFYKDDCITGKETVLNIFGYFENEPFMDIPNLLKNIRIYDNELSSEKIKSRYDTVYNKIDNGKFLDNTLHFIVQPYLHYVTQNSINITWETSEPCKSIIRYGEELPLQNIIVVENPDDINELEIKGLKQETPYFYSIISTNKAGEEVNSGILTLKTANKETTPFAFAVIGDTESRPHINNRVSHLIWDERPDFLVHLGDITDGGKQSHKFEWTYEYFEGMSSLISRVPVFPVPGNGEGDLFWYKAYHKLPGQEEFYSFKYGNAEFFMLNSVEKEEFKPGGKQYEWLDESLANSDATWKFVCHHYAPYSSDEDDYGNTWEGKSTRGDEQIREIVPIYEKYNVDVVFYGHLHCYERSHKILKNQVSDTDGVTYVMSGGAGGNLEDFAPTRSFFAAKTFRGHHYVIVTINNNTLQLRMYDLEGRMLDYLDFKK